MKRIGMLAVAVLAVALPTTGCLNTYANGGVGMRQRYEAPSTGFGGKMGDLRLYGNTVEIEVVKHAGDRRVQNNEPYIRSFLEAAVITSGAEPVKTGGTLKLEVIVADLETLMIVTIRVKEGEALRGTVTEECDLPRYENRASNRSVDEFFVIAFREAATKAIRFFY